MVKIRENRDCGCSEPIQSLAQWLECLLKARLPGPSCLCWVPGAPHAGGRENPSRSHFLFSTPLQIFLVPGSSSPESFLSEDSPGHSSRPGGAVLPISCLSHSAFESEGLSLEPSSEPLPSLVTLRPLCSPLLSLNFLIYKMKSSLFFLAPICYKLKCVCLPTNLFQHEE